jgi:hypothetical protein
MRRPIVWSSLQREALQVGGRVARNRAHSA